MRMLPAGFLMFALLAGAAASTAVAADDPVVARAKEMLRRTQEALRQAQSDNADLQRAKTLAEQKLQATTKELDAAKKNKAAQASMNAKLTSAAAAQADLTQKLSDAIQQLNATNAKLGETGQQLAARDAQLAQVKQALEQSKTATASCEDKNAKLYTYGQEMVERYRTKGVWSALSQKDPVFGLKDVDVENVVQEYRLKLSDQKIRPRAP